jgi:hypothetical protein
MQVIGRRTCYVIITTGSYIPVKFLREIWPIQRNKGKNMSFILLYNNTQAGKAGY